MSYERSPVFCVSNFLNGLLISGIDVGRQLEQYKNNGHLSKTTHFVTSNGNGCTRCSQAMVLSKPWKKGAIGNLQTDAILRLAQLILDTNCLAYGTKRY